MAFPSASFWSRVSFTVAVNGAPFLGPGPPKLVVHPVTQGLCAFAIGRERRRVETAASTVEVLDRNPQLPWSNWERGQDTCGGADGGDYF